jgi:hypothetical protein
MAMGNSLDKQIADLQGRLAELDRERASVDMPGEGRARSP